jgi:triosephosphate isomerase
MHKSVGEAVELVDRLLPDLTRVDSVDRVLCPAYVALSAVADRLAGSGLALGAQNVFWEEEGAYTGEISPLMLRGMCEYVIVGHSERRAYFHESDETVNRRVAAVLKHGMIPILCVGETLEEREGGQTEAVVRRMLVAGLEAVEIRAPQDLVIAYEPVWAIGTGRAATPDDAEQVIGDVVRSVLSVSYGDEIAQGVRVLYGGSVKPDNARDFFERQQIDGALVGGASLKAEPFSEIVHLAAL